MNSALPRLTGLQERAMWAMVNLGMVTSSTRVDDKDPPWIVASTIRSLHRKKLVTLDERGRLGITATEGMAYQSPLIWEARLTRAGQEWVAEHMVVTEGLPSPPPRVMV